MEEKKFPIYFFWMKWDQVGFQKNFTSWCVMYKEKPTEEQLNNDLLNAMTQREEKQANEEKPIIKWLDTGWKYVED